MYNNMVTYICCMCMYVLCVCVLCVFIYHICVHVYINKNKTNPILKRLSLFE